MPEWVKRAKLDAAMFELEHANSEVERLGRESEEFELTIERLRKSLRECLELADPSNELDHEVIQRAREVLERF